MTTKESAYKKVSRLVGRFSEQYESYKKADYNETMTRRDFIDPFFKALGWDMDNENGYAEAYREVIHEDKVKVGKTTQAPDYSFRLPGGKRLFFVEAKKPSVAIKEDVHPAYQVRRYGWSAKLPISIVTDFEEFAVYDCTKKPSQTDKVSTARIKYLTFRDYPNEFDFLWDTFGKESVLKGSFDRFIRNDTRKKGTTTVDEEFLKSLDQWRTYLATSISRHNRQLSDDEINFAVQQTIDRIIFLRIAEDRDVEPYGTLKYAIGRGDFYPNLLRRFEQADEKYNSGLFDLKRDKITPSLVIDNKTIKTIVNELYYPASPYEFSVLSADILGSAYEQFLGKVIRITSAHTTKVEEKPEVRKAGGVFYTPQYIVDYIVRHTVGKLLEGKTPQEAGKLKILDPACGSGSFLIGAYQYLLDWHKNYYSENGKPSKGKTDNPLTPEGNLTTAEKKRILLNNIYGVDIDANAVEVTKLSLLLKCMEGETQASIANQLNLFNERVLPTLDNNIKSGNSLIDLDFYEGEIDFGEEKKIKPFSWEKAFPEVFNRQVAIDPSLDFKKQYRKVKKLYDDTEELISSITTAQEPQTLYHKRNSGFDCVIGNPPYVQVSNPNMLQYFNRKYLRQDYQKDLYLLFLEQYKKLLVTGGMLGIIIPNTWMQSLKFINIRRYLITEYYWERIMHISGHIFKAVVDTHVLIFERNNYIKNSTVYIDLYQNNEVKNRQTIDQYQLPDNGDIINILASEEEKKLFEKIKAKSCRIIDQCFVYNGVKPFEKGKGTPPQTAKIMKEKPYVFEGENPPKGKNWMPLLRGSLINRYVNRWNKNSWIQYGNWLAAPRDPEIFKRKEKIVVRQTGDSIIATLIGENRICRNNLHIIISDILNHKFILGILNSKLTDFYYNQINPEKGEALAEVKKQHVEQLPVPMLENSQPEFDKIVDFVDKLLSINKDLQTTTLPDKIAQLKQRIAYTEDRINALVYGLYDLTKEEINIIEKNTEKNDEKNCN